MKLNDLIFGKVGDEVAGGAPGSRSSARAVVGEQRRMGRGREEGLMTRVKHARSGALCAYTILGP